MNWRAIRNHFIAWCDICHAPLPVDVDCYYQRDSITHKGRIICTVCHGRYGDNASSSPSPSTTTTTTTPTPIAPSREQAIAKAHMENMEANQRLVDMLGGCAEALVVQLGVLTTAVVDLMRVESDRNALLKQGLKP